MKYIANFFIAILFFGVIGCGFKELKNELKELDRSFSIAGEIVADAPAIGPIIVILIRHNADNSIIQQIAFPEDTGDFSFLVTEGTYSLVAFEDTNSNMQYDEAEQAGLHENSSVLTIPSEADIASGGYGNVSNLTIRLSLDDNILKVYPQLAEMNLSISKSLVRLGTITKLDDPIFQQENGSLGYWKPTTFLKTLGYGIFFLEPYDSTKIPVLFVHGAVGTPSGWAPIVEAMDRDKYQPWFFYYPSGVSLQTVHSALTETMKQIHEKYPFQRLVITAHSMGGIVSRGFIKQYAMTNDPADIDLFISISTPWGGSKMATKGVKNAPVAVQSWHDMAHDSQFLHDLYQGRMPRNVKHHLIFSFKGKCNMWMNNNDGTVELESELDYRAQREAAAIFGLNEEHTEILKSQDLINEYNQILDP